ncbi:hypothetical protein Sango_2794000 [Sesamum angolense]|uniref:RNase H type-1 domain-containing protein n=1 Tax=Sesamum angolense TaxID=2727404 RepID=A0AAE1T846_9LAMI|nr:hypothetical protein Sango_2794000 [Sesamum angolense]
MGRITTWSRFISKTAEKTLPFFKVLRKTKNFEWDASYQQAFEELKKYLAGLPLLVKPAQGYTLYLYLSVTPKAIGSVLVREEEGKQMPIYYVSKVLNGAKGRYAPIKKIALALVVTARRLRPYFLTSCQSQYKSTIEANIGKTRYFLKFGEIGRGIKRIRHLIPTTNNDKSSSLSGFRFQDSKNIFGGHPKIEKWLLHMDESSTIQGSGAGVVITSPNGEDLEFAVKFGFKASNNEAKYEALLIGMKMAHELGARHLVAYSDSQLVVKEVEGIYKAKEESMIQYLQQIAELKTSFESFQLAQIPQQRKYQNQLLLQTCQFFRRLPDEIYYHTITPQAKSSFSDPRNLLCQGLENTCV